MKIYIHKNTPYIIRQIYYLYYHKQFVFASKNAAIYCIFRFFALALKIVEIIFTKSIDTRFFRVYNADNLKQKRSRNYALQNKCNCIRVFLLLLLFRKEINSRSDFCCAEKALKKFFMSFAVGSLQGSYFF